MDMSLLDRIQQQVEAANSELIQVTKRVDGRTERLKLVRQLPDGSYRYLVVSWAGAPGGGLPEDTFSILGGSYGHPDPSRNSDGRHWGNMSITLRVISMWLIDRFDDWTALPRS